MVWCITCPRRNTYRSWLFCYVLFSNALKSDTFRIVHMNCGGFKIEFFCAKSFVVLELFIHVEVHLTSSRVHFLQNMARRSPNSSAQVPVHPDCPSLIHTPQSSPEIALRPNKAIRENWR